MLNWTERYRPISLAEIIGNRAAIEDLKKWASGWISGIPEKRGVILAGSPGTGKTTAAHALAHEFGWGIIELNASDTRNYEAIKRIAGFGALYETFTDTGKYISSREGGRKLIILDEADNLFGTEDRGGLLAIVEILRTAMQPVVLIANDYYELTRKSSALKDLCLTIRFMSIRKDTIKSVLAGICEKAGIKVDGKVLEALAELAHGDLRSAINDLECICEGKTRVTEEALSSVGARDLKKTMFSALGVIFKSTSLTRARDVTKDLDEPPDYVIMWVDENLPLEYKNAADLNRGYELLSRADVFLGRIIRRQNYDLWAYASDIMTGGIAVAKREPYREFAKYQFPAWLSKMARSRSARAVQDSILGKLGVLCHTSKATARADIFHWFKYLFKNEREFAVSMSAKLELREEEVAYILDVPPDSENVSSIRKEVEKRLGSGKEVKIKRYES